MCRGNNFAEKIAKTLRVGSSFNAKSGAIRKPFLSPGQIDNPSNKIHVSYQFFHVLVVEDKIGFRIAILVLFVFWNLYRYQVLV